MKKKAVALTGASGNMGYQGFLELYAQKEKFRISLLLRASEKTGRNFRNMKKTLRFGSSGEILPDMRMCWSW